jgi:hypothetical protein
MALHGTYMQESNAFSKSDAKWWPLVLEWLERVLLRDDLELALVTITDPIEHVMKHFTHHLREKRGVSHRLKGGWEGRVSAYI